MGSLLGPALLPGNRVTALCNGDEIFPAMLGAIAGARHSITFETYIYWSGAIGKAFADALSERARAGIKVHVLVDWVGSGKMDQGIIEEMQEAGVEFVKYHPLRWYTLGGSTTAPTASCSWWTARWGSPAEWGSPTSGCGNAQDPDHWRDSHFKLEGPAVAQMQSAFMDNWIETRATGAPRRRLFPAARPGRRSGRPGVQELAWTRRARARG